MLPVGAVCEGVNECRRGSNNAPPGTGGVARRAGVVVKSKWFSLIPMNEWGGELFDPSTTPALRATPPVPGGKLVLPLLCDHPYSKSFRPTTTCLEGGVL